MASIEKDAIKVLHSLSECCICLTTYKDPRILSCLHTCCLKCFEDIQTKSEKKNGDVLACPLCRKEFTIPPQGMNGLQKNFFIENLIEMTKALKSETRQIVCSSCSILKESGSATEAKMRCLNCCENFCLPCAKIHQGLKLTKDHKIVEMNAALNEEEMRNMFPIRNCNKHSEKVLDYYCSDCKIVVCVSCFVEDHQNHKCKDVKTVDKDFRKTLEIKGANISDYSEQMLSEKTKLERRKREFLEKILASENAIKEKSQNLTALIDQHAKYLLGELSQMKQKHQKVLETEIEEIERRKAVLDSFVLYCTELTSKASASDVCGSVDSLTSRAKELSEEIDKYLSGPDKSVDIEFIATDHKVLLQNASNIIGKLTESARLLENYAIVNVRHNDANNITKDFIKINLNRSEDYSNLPPVPTEMQSYASAAVYCNSIFVTGIGKNHGEIWKFNGTSSSWMKCASLIRGRYLHSVAFVNHLLFICGGRLISIHRPFDDVEAYDAINDKCSKVGQLKYAVYCSSNCVPFKDSLYIFGGKTANNSYANSIQVYDTKTNTCSLLSKPMPRAACLLRAVLLNNSVILLGYSSCFTYNFDTETWQVRDRFKTGVYYFGVSVANGKIFVIKGLDTKSSDVRSVPIWNILNDEPIEWKHHAKLPCPSEIFVSGQIKMVA